MDCLLRLEHWQSVCLIWIAPLSISPGFIFHCVPPANLPLCMLVQLSLPLSRSHSLPLIF